MLSWKRAGSSVLGLAALGLAACADETRGGPAVTVQRLDEAQACYAHCEGSSPVDASVAAAIGITPCPGAAAGAACSFEGGRDRIRVIADYGDLAFDSCLSVDTPALTMVLEDEGAVDVPAVVPGCAGGARYFAHKTLAAPVAASDAVRFRVSSGQYFFTDTPPYPLSPPALTLSVERCSDASGEPLMGCSLVAGIDSTLMTVTVPDVVGEDQATIQWTTGFESSGEVTVALKRTSETTKSGSFRLKAPDEAGNFLSITAQSGDLFTSYDPIELASPRPLQVDVARLGEEPDFDPATAPVIAAGEPSEACRRVTAAVLAPDGAPEDLVTLQTSLGTLDGAGVTVQKELVGSGSSRTATAILELPKSATFNEVKLLASAGGGLTGTLSLPLGPVLPSKASIATTKKFIKVGAAGSEALTLTGFALPPTFGATFPAGTKLSVVVTATDDNVAILPCGAPVSEADLGCDPTKGGELPGGCLLAPTSVAVGPSGEFSIQLAAGICFTGTVLVDVYSKVYTSSEACLGDRAVTDQEVRLTTGPVLSLKYEQ